MILDFLDPSVVAASAAFLRQWIVEERDSLRNGNRDSQDAAGAQGASTSDADAAGAEIEEWQRQEVIDLSGAGGDRPPIWVPRDPIGSLLISELDGFVSRLGLTSRSTSRGFAAGEDALSAVSLTGEARDLLTGGRRRFLPRFGERDGRFLTWGAVAKISTWLKGGRAAFPAGDGPVFPIADNARLILVSDWGSGIPRAEKVATAMRLFVEESLRNKQDCHVIHLGDVYYCGWRREYESRFLEQWPVYPEEKDTVGSFCLNANHDMYSGGYDYFGFLLAEPRFWRHQGHSHFALENSHWQIAGLDTAYEDAALHGNQAGWLARLRRQSPKKKGMLLSHHQPFTSYKAEGEKDSPRLLGAVQPLLNEGLVRAWFWGHEHRCAVYKPQAGIEYPRLIGHGGVPVYAWAGQSHEGVEWETPDTLTDPRTGWKYARFGFSVLDFKGDGSVAHRYVSENGRTQREEVLSLK